MRGHPEEEARLWMPCVLRGRPFERRLGVLRDDAVRRSDQGFAEIRLKVCFTSFVLAVDPQCIAPRLHGVIEAAEPHVDRRDYLPAAAVFGIFLKMRFDLCDERIERAVLQRRGGAARNRLSRHIGRAKREIERRANRRQRHKGGERRPRGGERLLPPREPLLMPLPRQPPRSGAAKPRRARLRLPPRRSGRRRDRVRSRRSGRDRPRHRRPRAARAHHARAATARRRSPPPSSGRTGTTASWRVYITPSAASQWPRQTPRIGSTIHYPRDGRAP